VPSLLNTNKNQPISYLIHIEKKGKNTELKKDWIVSISSIPKIKRLWIPLDSISI